MIATAASGAELSQGGRHDQVIGWALGHVLEQPEPRRPLLRYVWIPAWLELADQQPHQAVAAGLVNYAAQVAVSSEGLILPLEVAAGGQLVVLDFQRLVSDPKRRDQVLQLWEQAALADPYWHAGGDWAAYVDQDAAELLSEACRSSGPVLRADWFVDLVLRRQYYEWRGYVDADGQLLNQRDVYASLGVDEQLAKQVGGDQRAALFVSGVTAKPRRVDRLQGAGGRWNTGAVWQTWDIGDASVGKVRKHPLYNLLEFFPDGGEAIAELPNGLHAYLLYDATEDRKLVREVPPDIALDHTVPAPHTAPVTGAMSCIVCHGENGGLQPVPNEVQLLLRSGLDIFADGGQVSAAVINRLAGLYAGDFRRRLVIGRQDYDQAVRRATLSPKLPEGLGATEAAKALRAVRDQYLYDGIDAAVAVRELDLSDNTKFAEVYPPRAGQPENVTMAALRAGLVVARADWEAVYAAARLEVSDD